MEISFLDLADFVIPAIPAGYFFGRIGNFLNGELFGRITQKSWGMYFPGETMLRHPSQLYEAFFEGIILFLILWIFRNNKKLTGQFLPLYLLGYAFFRFWLEFWREPDAQIGLVLNFFTLGQTFSLIMAGLALILFYFYNKIKMKK
jgi:phosphatidylglycerol:prolipoprotein diacylglycerol transferase